MSCSGHASRKGGFAFAAPTPLRARSFPRAVHFGQIAFPSIAKVALGEILRVLEEAHMVLLIVILVITGH
jgi:hypothetical protein